MSDGPYPSLEPYRESNIREAKLVYEPVKVIAAHIPMTRQLYDDMVAPFKHPLVDDPEEKQRRLDAEIDEVIC